MTEKVILLMPGQKVRISDAHTPSRYLYEISNNTLIMGLCVCFRECSYSSLRAKPYLFNNSNGRYAFIEESPGNYVITEAEANRLALNIQLQAVRE